MGRNLFEYHPVIGYRFIPGLKARVRHESGGYLVRCNQAGFRSDHEATVEKPKNTFRIVVCGDSYTAGDGVSNGKRYTDVLENNFENLQVLNFGLPGSGTGQQFLAFKEYAAALDYDLLIICPMVENIIRVEAKARETMNSTDGDLVSRPKPYFELNDGQLELKNQPVPRETKPVVRGADGAVEEDVSAVKQAVRKMYGHFPWLKQAVYRARDIRHPPQYEDPNNDGWRVMRAILEAWVDLATAPVIICTLPTYAHIEEKMRPDGYQARFRELGSNCSAEMLDALPTFLSRSLEDRQTSRFPVDEHPNVAGHKIIAEALTSSVAHHYDQWRSKHD